jgi:hypothetical protein
MQEKKERLKKLLLSVVIKLIDYTVGATIAYYITKLFDR